MLQNNDTKNMIEYARTNGQIELKVELVEPKKDTFVDITINLAMAYLAGYICKKILVGKSTNPMRKIGGLVIEMMVANEVYKNANTIKMVGGKIVHKIIRKYNQ
jgi:hypothetical protein